MTLIYLSTGTPGEAATALQHAPDPAFTRTVRGYTEPEENVERVYADDEIVRQDYRAEGVEVYDLHANVLYPQEDEPTQLEDTEIG